MTTEIAVGRYPSDVGAFADLEACIENFVLPGFLPPAPVISRSDVIRTHGSCFAENIALAMRACGMNARHFDCKEAVNSPAVNEQLFKYINSPDMPYLCPEHERSFVRPMLHGMRAKIATEAVFIYSLGVAPFSERNGVPFVPENSEATKAAGMRFPSVAEVERAITTVVTTIRAINPTIKVVLTVSPVHLTGMVGEASGIAADCVSKSILRAATWSYMQSAPSDIHYWPSYEIVRWLGGHTGPAFGVDDGNARHVNKSLVDMIVRLFIKHFVAPVEGVANLT